MQNNSVGKKEGICITLEHRFTVTLNIITDIFFKKIILSKHFFHSKSHSAEKEASPSSKAFSTLKTLIKVKVATFDQVKIVLTKKHRTVSKKT